MDNIRIRQEINNLIKNNDVDKLTVIFRENKAMLDYITPFGTWLHVAAINGKLKVVKKLIELGMDINKKGGVFGGSILNTAATKGHIDIVEYLLAIGAEIDLSSSMANPLIGAIISSHVDVSKLLINTGMDISIKYSRNNVDNYDALAYAKEHGLKEIVDILEDIQGESIDDNICCYEESGSLLSYINENFGEIKETISELIPGSEVAVSVNIIPSSEERNYITLITSGMSDLPMVEGEGSEEYKYAELVLKLPANWTLDKECMGDNDKFWPIQWIRRVAHIPHLHDGYLDEGIVIPNGEPPRPFSSNTKLSCIMAILNKKAYIKDKENDNTKIINFYNLIPIYNGEWDIVKDDGYYCLLDVLKDNDILDVLDINRVDVSL